MSNLNQIILGDCLEVMKGMPEKSVDYVITSPPYNVGWNNMHGKDFTRYDEVEDKMTQLQYEEWLFKVLDECLRVTKKHIFFNIQMLANNKSTIGNIFHRYQKNFKDLIIWNKAQAPPAIEPGVMTTAFEFIIILSNDRPEKRKFYDANFHANFRNVIEGNSASATNQYAEVHKATFPLYLPETLITQFTKEGEIILDPFVGTGTTCLAAKNLKRNFIGIDVSDEYCKIAKDRLRQEVLL